MQKSLSANSPVLTPLRDEVRNIKSSPPPKKLARKTLSSSKLVKRSPSVILKELDKNKSPILMFQEFVASFATLSACFSVGLAVVLVENQLRDTAMTKWPKFLAWMLEFVGAIWRAWSWRSLEKLESKINLSSKLKK